MGHSDVKANMFRGDLVHTGTFESSVPDNNTLLWSFDTNDPIESSAVVVDGKVYFGSGNGNVYCLDASTGAEIWNFTTNNEVDSTPAVVDGVVYVGSADRKLYAIDAEFGNELWNYSLEISNGQIASSPALAHGLVFVGTTDDSLYAINVTTHDLEWSFPTDNDIWSSPAVSWPYVYVGSLDGKVYCVWANNGTQKWIFEPEETYEIYSTPTVSNGAVIVGAASWGVGGALYSINASTGEKLWTFSPPGDNRSSEVYSSPAVHEETVFIHAWYKIPGQDSKGTLYALPENDPNGDGNITIDEIEWSFTTWDHEGGSSPAVANGKVLVGSTNGKLYCLDESSGEEIWNLTTGGFIVSSPTIANGVVYIGSNDGSLYAVGGIGSAPLNVQILPEFPSIKSGRVMGISFLVTYRGTPIEGAFINFDVSEGNLSQNGASTFPDGTQRIKYTAWKVEENTTITIYASVTKFGYPEGESSAQFIVESPSSYGKVSTSSMFSLSKYWMYLMIIGTLIAVNVVIVILGTRKRNEEGNKNHKTEEDSG